MLLKKFGGRIPNFIVNYLPLFIAAFSTALAEFFASGKAEFSEETFYGGLMSYSLGTIVSVGIRKLLHGEKIDDALLLLVQGVAEKICIENANAEFTKIVGIIKTLMMSNNNDEYSLSAKNDVAAILKTVVKEGVSEMEINSAAEIILLSAQNLIKEK